MWREGLLARAVLRGATRGYKNHPQLERFRRHKTPISAINHYLSHIADEASRRGYNFDQSKIGPIRNRSRLAVTSGQLEFELSHLKKKVRGRAPGELLRLPTIAALMPHPLFKVRNGQIETWEKGAP